MGSTGDSSDQNVTLEPGKLVDQNDNFCLQHKDILTLLKYVWTGINLPTTVDGYKKVISAKTLDQSIEKDLVVPMLEDFKVIQTNNKDFHENKTTGYDTIVQVADNVYTYASTSGGNPELSFYANIIQGVTDLNTALKATPKDQAKIDSAKETVRELVQFQNQQIDDLVKQANGAVTNLKDFESKSQISLTALQNHQNNANQTLGGDTGEMAHLSKLLDDERAELRSDEEEYEHDVIVACTALTYAWIFPAGTIAAGVVMGIYGKKATDMKGAIDGMHQLIHDNEAQLEQDKTMIAQLNMITAELQSLVSTAQAAIAVIQTMIGYWNGVSADLSAIEKMIDDTQGGGFPAVMKLSQKQIISKWNTLAASAKKYRETAYVTAVEETSVKDWATSGKVSS